MTAIFISFIILFSRRGTSGRMSFSIAKVFEASIDIDADSVRRAEEDIEKAAAENKDTREPPGPIDIGEIPQTRLMRILWVDDNPDGNINEIIALERLGFFVTKATRTESALRYLRSGLGFSLVVSDARRNDDHTAGQKFLELIRADGDLLPTIIYTMGAQRIMIPLLASGATAVVETPEALVGHALRVREKLTEGMNHGRIPLSP